MKTYNYRWVVLGGFMGINLTIQLLWICFAPVAVEAREFYGVSDLMIALLAMVFMLVYLPASVPASWLIDRIGFRRGVGLGAVLLGVCGLLRGVVAENYTLVMICTVGLALAQPLLLNAVTTVAAKWFPPGERAIAAGLAMAANFLGATIGLMLTPKLFERYGLPQTQMIYGIAAAVSAAVFLATARETPPTPPGGPQERALMLDGLKLTLRLPDFWVCMVVFFVGVGVFNGLATWIEDMVRPKGQDLHQAGMLGGLLMIGGVAGAFAIPLGADLTRRRKPWILGGMATAVPGLLAFTYFHSYPLLIGSVLWLGFFMLGIAPIGYQYAAEITMPAPEGTSNGLLMLAGQLSVIFIAGMGLSNDWLHSFTPSLLGGAVLMLLSCVLIARIKESTPGAPSPDRLDAE